MIGAMTSRASAARQSWRRWTPALAGLGIVTLAATACGSSGTTAATPQVSSSSPSPASSQQAFPGVTGTAASVSGSSMEVQNPTSGQVTVTFTAATSITQEVTVPAKDVTVGSCVTVIGQPPAGGSASGSASRAVTATTVTVSAPVKGSCNAAGGFGGFGGRPGGNASPRASFSPRPRPSGSRGGFGGGFGGANGKVTSLSASGFVVQGRNPAASAGATITVTTTSATKYLKVVAARSSALKVGECIIAVGTTDSIGAVAARTIRVSQPGPNGCVTGFGGRRGGFGSSPGGPSSNA